MRTTGESPQQHLPAGSQALYKDNTKDKPEAKLVPNWVLHFHDKAFFLMERSFLPRCLLGAVGIMNSKAEGKQRLAQCIGDRPEGESQEAGARLCWARRGGLGEES